MIPEASAWLTGAATELSTLPSHATPGGLLGSFQWPGLEGGEHDLHRLGRFFTWWNQVHLNLKWSNQEIIDTLENILGKFHASKANFGFKQQVSGDLPAETENFTNKQQIWGQNAMILQYELVDEYQFKIARWKPKVYTHFDPWPNEQLNRGHQEQDFWQETSPRGSEICGLFLGFNAMSFLGYLWVSDFDPIFRQTHLDP